MNIKWKLLKLSRSLAKKLEHIEYFIQVGFYKTQAQWKHNKMCLKTMWQWMEMNKYMQRSERWKKYICKGQNGHFNQTTFWDQPGLSVNVFNKYWMLMWFLTSVECKCELNATEGFVWSWSSVKHCCRPEEKWMNV